MLPVYKGKLRREMTLGLVENEDVIELVKKHPCIYDITCDDNKSRLARNDAWLIICKSLFKETWGTMSRAEQILTGREVQRRWKALKDAFARTLRSTENRTETGCLKKPYIYHKQLCFLIPHLQARSSIITDRNSKQNTYCDDFSQSNQEISDTNMSSDPLALPDEQDPQSPYTAEDFLTDLERQEPPPEPSPIPNKRRRTVIPEERAIEPNDPDLMFFYSLIPNIRKLNPSEKVQFQIDVLQCLKKFIDASQDVSSGLEEVSPSKSHLAGEVPPQKCNIPIKLEPEFS